MSIDDAIHILPVNDNKSHMDGKIEKIICKCDPTLFIENNSLLVRHNSHDRREYNEIAQKIFKDNL